MARVAAEPVASASELAGLIFQPTPGRMQFALRVATICAATTLVGEMYQMPPELALAVYVVFFLNAPDRARSVILGIVMTGLLTLCLLIILAVALRVMDHPTQKVLSIAVLSFVFLFLGTASLLGEVAGTVALIVGYGLDTMSRLPVGDLATRAVLYAWLFVGIPTPLSILFNLMMAPSPRTLVQRRLAAGLRCAAKLLTDPDPVTRRCVRESLRHDAEETPKLLKLAGLERVSPRQDIEALRQAALSTRAILALAELGDRDADACPPAPIRARFAETLENMAAILADGGYPLEIDAPRPDAVSLGPRAAAVVGELRAQLGSFADPPPAAAEAPAPKARGGFFRPDAFTNPEYAQHALRTTGAAMTCYLIYKLLDWPAIHTCFITCYIVSLGTVGDSIEKLALRISGCLVGAAAGIAAIVFVIPHMSTSSELLPLVFLGTGVSAWVTGGRPQIAYAGFQMAFAFLLCVLQHYATGSDMVTDRDRIWVVLIGNAVAFIFFTRLWPVSVGRRIGGESRRRAPASSRPLRRGQPPGRTGGDGPRPGGSCGPRPRSRPRPIRAAFGAARRRVAGAPAAGERRDRCLVWSACHRGRCGRLRGRRGRRTPRCTGRCGGRPPRQSGPRRSSRRARRPPAGVGACSERRRGRAGSSRRHGGRSRGGCGRMRCLRAHDGPIVRRLVMASTMSSLVCMRDLFARPRAASVGSRVGPRDGAGRRDTPGRRGEGAATGGGSSVRSSPQRPRRGDESLCRQHRRIACVYAGGSHRYRPIPQSRHAGGLERGARCGARRGGCVEHVSPARHGCGRRRLQWSRFESNREHRQPRRERRPAPLGGRGHCDAGTPVAPLRLRRAVGAGERCKADGRRFECDVHRGASADRIRRDGRLLQACGGGAAGEHGGEGAREREGRPGGRRAAASAGREYGR